MFAGHGRSAGELEPQLGEIAEAGWLERAEIAGTLPRLHRLLALIDTGGEPVVYWRGERHQPPPGDGTRERA